MKPEELSDAIIEFQSKHAVSDTTWPLPVTSQWKRCTP